MEDNHTQAQQHPNTKGTQSEIHWQDFCVINASSQLVSPHHGQHTINGNQQFTRIFVKSFWCSHIWVCWSMLILWCGDDSSGVQGWHQSIGHKIAKMRRLATSKHREMMDFNNYPSSQLFHWNSTSIAVIWNLALFKSNHCGEQSEKARLSLYLIIAGTVIAPSLHLSLSLCRASKQPFTIASSLMKEQ